MDCSFGMCSSPTCEKCKPKLVTCPSCGEKTILGCNICMFCDAEIPEDVQQEAVEAWKRTHVREQN